MKNIHAYFCQPYLENGVVSLELLIITLLDNSGLHLHNFMDVKLLMKKGNRLFTNVCLEVAWLGLIEIKKLENKDLNQTLVILFVFSSLSFDVSKISGHLER